MSSFDLHVLGTPPAFILSQDQTLMFKCLSSLSLTLGCSLIYLFKRFVSLVSLKHVLMKSEILWILVNPFI